MTNPFTAGKHYDTLIGTWPAIMDKELLASCSLCPLVFNGELRQSLGLLGSSTSLHIPDISLQKTAQEWIIKQFKMAGLFLFIVINFFLINCY